ncbi:MAG TPA: RNA polymerase sigma-70 factor, partial [Cytophagales bacterium]|nr:RNA polymerase sigma-70 factor [Cytophagales bacterium]
IANLPEKTQLVFTLSRYEELSYKEIALQMGLSIKAIEKHMGKALKLLKSALNEHLLSLLILSDYFL